MGKNEKRIAKSGARFFNNSLTKKLIASAVVISIIGVGLFYVNPATKTNNADNLSKQKPLKGINKPFPDMEVEYEVFEIESSEKNDILTKGGSLIIIPENAFIDSVGNTVEGKVVLKYKEYRDMADVFLSGIPMVYDSAGSEYHFQSAGMFELNGFQNNSPIYIASNKDIEIGFASDYDGEEYNKYQYDKNGNRWRYLEKDIPLKLQIDKNVVEHIDLDELPKGVLMEPKLASKNKFKIQIDVIADEFPEIAPYKNVKFQILNEEEFNPKLSKIEWDNIKVTREDDSTYLLEFQKGKRKEVFKCSPVFDSEDYEQALVLFKQQVEKSNNELEQKKEKKARLFKKFKDDKDSQTLSLIRYRLSQEYLKEQQITQRRVYRIFQINSFGIFNSDCPRVLPKGKMLAAKFKDKLELDDTLFLNHYNVYLVEKSSNTLFTYFKYSLSTFSFNPEKDNMIWTVTDDNKLAVLSYKSFNEIPFTDEEDYVFKMKLTDVSNKTESQIKEILASNE